jgi:hypothetical protein
MNNSLVHKIPKNCPYSRTSKNLRWFRVKWMFGFKMVCVPSGRKRLDQPVSYVLMNPKCIHNIVICCITLWLFNIAMENGPFIDGLPIKNGDFPWLC